MSIHLQVKEALLRADEVRREILSSDYGRKIGLTVQLYVYPVDPETARRKDPEVGLKDDPRHKATTLWCVASNPPSEAIDYFCVRQGAVHLVHERVVAAVVDGELVNVSLW